MNIAIAFQGGSYGSYLKWVLYQLIYSTEIITPWKTGGTSHDNSYILDRKVLKPHLDFKEISKSKNYELFSIHPVKKFGDNFVKNVEVINNYVDKLIIPYPDNKMYLHAFHNYLNKVWISDNKWETSLKYTDPDDLKNGWGVTNPHNAPKWILREYFSFNVFESFNSQYGWYAPNYFTQGHFVFLTDLLYNFQSTIDAIQQYLNVEWKRSPLELQKYHEFNVSRQQNLSQDAIAEKIINSIDQTPIKWNAEDLTIYTEAFIQMTLRKKGILLKCSGLDNFPTSTTELIEVFE